jgi:tetratricopeptide (TPR) repeat protein
MKISRNLFQILPSKIIGIVLLNILLSIFSSFGQTRTIDSLQSLLKTNPADTIKISIFDNLFLEYEFSDDKKAGDALKDALTLAQKIDYKRGKALLYTHYAFFAEDKGNYQDALKNYFSALKEHQAMGDQQGIADIYNDTGAFIMSREIIRKHWQIIF